MLLVVVPTNPKIWSTPSARKRFHNCPAGHHLRHLFRSPLLVVLAVFIVVSVDLPGVL